MREKKGCVHTGAFQRTPHHSQRFEFRYPATYVQDQTVFLRNADAAYNQRMLDPTLGPTRARPRVWH